MRSLNNEQLKSLFGASYEPEPNELFNSGFTIRITETKENTIKRVIFNNPATIILWENGTKTVVKVQEGDKYDKRVGFLMCYLKGIVGNKTLLKEVEKWLSEKE